MYVNTNYDFTIALANKVLLARDEWEVGLAEIFIPNYGLNIKAPHHKGMKINYNREITDEERIGLVSVLAVDYTGVLEGWYMARS